jgi:uncharacterized membrane protein YsdA (DUF1294 family)
MVHHGSGRTPALIGWIMKPLDGIILCWIALASLSAFFLFGFDKWRAQKSGWRISEWHLALLSAVGGWPGGLLGMLLFRHKMAKSTFQLKFCFAFLVFAAGLASYLTWRRQG